METLEDFIINQVKSRPRIYSGHRNEEVDKLIEKDFDDIAKASKIKHMTGTLAKSLWEKIEKKYINDVRQLEGHNEKEDDVEYPHINMTRVYNLSFLYETVNATISSKTSDNDIKQHSTHSSLQDCYRVNDSSEKPLNSHQKYDRKIVNRYKAKNSTHDPELLKMRAELDEGIDLLFKRYQVDKNIKKDEDVRGILSSTRGTESYSRTHIRSALQGMKNSHKPNFYTEVTRLINDHKK